MQDLFTKYWNKGLEIGIRHARSREEIKRVRLVNSISMIGLTAYLLWSLIYAFDGIGITSLEAFAAAVLLMICLFFNYLGFFDLACYFHYFSMTLIVVYYGIAHGEKDSAHFLLFVTCIISLIYFNNRWLLAFLFLFNMCCFFLVRYTHSIMDPLVLSGHNLYVPNIISAFTVLFAIAYYFKTENRLQEDLLKDQNKKLEIEKEKSEKLLLNILPYQVAEELKEKGVTTPQYYNQVTVLFTDFKGFSSITKEMSAINLVKELNEYFSAFDKIISKYNIEKIKTIGDAYLCVGGLPHPNDTRAYDVVKAAIEMRDYAINRQKSEDDKLAFEMRIGIHTGPVIAGVVGTSKFAYDIWGDTVNTASRLETACEVGHINISEYTYELVSDQFEVDHRGVLEVKNMGEIDMYYVIDESE